MSEEDRAPSQPVALSAAEVSRLFQDEGLAGIQRRCQRGPANELVKVTLDALYTQPVKDPDITLIRDTEGRLWDVSCGFTYSDGRRVASPRGEFTLTFNQDGVVVSATCPAPPVVDPYNYPNG